jgi:hypothetical protein
MKSRLSLAQTLIILGPLYRHVSVKPLYVFWVDPWQTNSSIRTITWRLICGFNISLLKHILNILDATQSSTAFIGLYRNKIELLDANGTLKANKLDNYQNIAGSECFSLFMGSNGNAVYCPQRKGPG